MSYVGHNLDVMPIESDDGLHMIGVYFCDFFYCVNSLGERDYFFISSFLVPSIVPGTQSVPKPGCE